MSLWAGVRGLAIVAVALAFLAAGLEVRHRGFAGGVAAGGPLYPAGSSVGGGGTVGKPQVFGLMIGFRDKHSAPIKLDGLTPVFANRDLTVRVAGYERPISTGAANGPLPPGGRAPRGMILAPDQHGDLQQSFLLEVTPRRPGHFRTNGVTVTFHRGLRHFRQRVGVRTEICVGRREQVCAANAGTAPS